MTFHTAADYTQQQTELIRSATLTAATILGDYMDDLAVVGGLVPSLLVPQTELPAGVDPHVGTMDLDLGLDLAILDDQRYEGIAERLRESGFTPDTSNKGNETRQRWTHSKNPLAKIEFLIPPVSDQAKAGKLQSLEAFKAKHYLDDDDLATLQAIKLPAERKIQDYRSTYNDIRDWLRREKSVDEKEKSTIDWDDVVFEVDLLKSQEINLDYILELIFENNKKIKDKAELVEDVRRVIRASLGNRAKESLLVDFINQTDLDQLGDKATVIEAFFTFAQAEQQREAQELINSESLNAEAARRYITTSLKREFASENGTELNTILPKMSPLNPQYLTKKQSVFQKIAAFVEKFKGVGGQI